MTARPIALLLALTLSAAHPAGASPLVITPETQRDVMLTIYNGNFGLVKDVRETRLPAGDVEAQYRDVAAQIDPTTVHLRSLTDPTAGMMPINRPVRITTKDGRTITGRRLNEDTHTVQVIDDKERLHSVAKTDIRTLLVETKSTMPAYGGKLSDEELADVVAYLMTLRGQL